MEVHRAHFLLVRPVVLSVSVCPPGFASATVTEVTAGVIFSSVSGLGVRQTEAHVLESVCGFSDISFLRLKRQR